jgi:hypothetical protein
MNYEILKAELASGHPDTGAYDADDAVAAAQLNAVNRTKNKTSMSGSEVMNAVDAAEWATLDAAQKQTVWDICHLGTVNPFGVEQALMIGVFGAGSATITALQAIRKYDVSRATELGLSRVREGTVTQARTM